MALSQLPTSHQILLPLLLKSRQVLLVLLPGRSLLLHLIAQNAHQVGDALVAVGGKGTVGRSLREVQNLLLGPPGSALTLSLASGARDPVVSV